MFSGITYYLVDTDLKGFFLSLQFHDTYCKICTRRKVSQLGQEDFLGLCNILETRGLLGIKRAKDTRSMKVSIKDILFWSTCSITC